jgi:transcriptional regulator with XRE-family HTH domain
MNTKILKKLREENKYSQKHIADYLSVSRPTYISIEQGERELNVSELQKLAKLFSLSLEELVSGKRDNEYKVELKELSKKSDSKKQEIRIIMEEANVDKFKEVLLYVLEKVGGKANVGETVLYKLLYFIDFDFYEKFEEQLTGARYMKNHHGPTPIEFSKIIENMIKNNELEKIKSSYFKYDQKSIYHIDHQI